MTDPVDPTRATSPPQHGRRAFGAFEFVFLFASTVAFLLLVRPVASAARFQYDEADYMTAARAGWAENYVERSTASFPSFVQKGLQAVREKTSRAELSEYIRSRGDISFYRHFHGPLYFDWLMLVHHFVHSESAHRLAGLTFHLLIFATLWLGIIWLFGPQARAAALVASSAYLFGTTAIRSSLELSVHALYTWLTLLALFAIARLMQRPDRRHLLMAVAAATIALCALEFGAFLFLVLGIGLLLIRRELVPHGEPRRWRGLILQSVATFVVVLGLIWPAGLFKLSLLKPFVNLAYQALSRKGVVAAAGGAEMLTRRFGEAPIEWALVLIGLVASAVVLISRRYRSQRALYPFLLYAILILLISWRAAPSRYLLSVFGPLYLLGGIVLGDLLRKRPAWIRVGSGVLVYAFFLVSAVRASPRRPAPAAHAVAPPDLVEVLSQEPDRIHSVLLPADYLPTVHYYLPRLSLKSYLAPSEENPAVGRLSAHEIDVLVLSSSSQSARRMERELAGSSRFLRREAWDGGPLTIYIWLEPPASR